MFDMTKLVKRYFEIKLPDGTFLELKPPSVKLLKQIVSLQDIEGEVEAYDHMVDTVVSVLSKNKAKKKITADKVGQLFDNDTLQAFLSAYLNWVTETVSSKN